MSASIYSNIYKKFFLIAKNSYYIRQLAAKLFKIEGSTTISIESNFNSEKENSIIL